MSHDDHQNSPQLNQSQWLTGTAITPIAIDMIQNAEREVVHQFHADLRLATGFCSQKALAGKSEIGV